MDILNRTIKDKIFWLSFIGFLALQYCLYVFILRFHTIIPLNAFNYTENAHHYIQDNRVTGAPFTLENGLASFDSQWYLRIAGGWYPKHPEKSSVNDKTQMESLTYAFFPVYPAIIAGIHRLVGNLERSAFYLSHILLIANVVSLYIVVSSIETKKTAVKTLFLLFTFPISIIFRGYFTEGLVMVELLWFCYFFMKKQWLPSSLILGLLLITHLRALFVLVVYAFIIIRMVYLKKIKQTKAALIGIITILPLLSWMMYCYMQTGDSLYFYAMQNAWVELPLYKVFVHNLWLIGNFFLLPFHSFHHSQLDVLTILTIPIILFFSRKTLKRELWLVSFSLWLGALLTHDTISFTRVQIISFPLFIALAKKLPSLPYFILLYVFLIGLFTASLFYVNWYWIG